MREKQQFVSSSVSTNANKLTLKDWRKTCALARALDCRCDESSSSPVRHLSLTRHSHSIEVDQHELKVLLTSPQSNLRLGTLWKMCACCVLFSWRCRDIPASCLPFSTSWRAGRTSSLTSPFSAFLSEHSLNNFEHTPEQQRLGREPPP